MNTIELEKIEIAGLGRFYKSPNTSQWYPSITTITGHTKSEFFAKWQAIPGNDKILALAAKSGEVVHEMVEKYLNGEEYSKEATMMDKLLFYQLKPELANITDIVLQEKSLFSDNARIAGRVDCIGYYNGKLSIIDFKTSKSPKKPDWITNYFEQATGYSIMFEEMTGRRIDNIVILMTCGDGDVVVYERNPKEYVYSLKKTMESYWSDKDFKKLQTVIKEKLNGM